MTDRLFDRETIARLLHKALYGTKWATPWEQLPEALKESYRLAADSTVIPYFEQQAQAAIAAVVEKAAQVLQRDIDVLDANPQSDAVTEAIARGFKGTLTRLKAEVSSLAPESAQVALREAKAEARLGEAKWWNNFIEERDAYNLVDIRRSRIAAYEKV